MNRKYVLHPGHVISKNDGQSHFVSAARLADLYGVSLRDCINADAPEYLAVQHSSASFTHLYPRRDGDYRVPGRAA